VNFSELEKKLDGIIDGLNLNETNYQYQIGSNIVDFSANGGLKGNIKISNKRTKDKIMFDQKELLKVFDFLKKNGALQR
jgi:hypothetical protein